MSHVRRTQNPRGALALLVAGGLLVFPPALFAQAKPAEWSPEAMLKVKQIPQVQVSPDGKRVAYVVRQAVMEGEKSEYVNQIHVADADGSGAFPLTQGEKSSDLPLWSPSGEWIAFLSERSGKRNLWAIRARGGEAEMLTDVKTGLGGFKWSPDGKWIAYDALEPPTAEEEKAKKEKNDARVVDENVKMNRLHIIPFAKDARGKREDREITRGNFSVETCCYDWAPDGKHIAFAHTRTSQADDWHSADISLVEVATATVKPLVHTGASEISPLYSPDGQSICYLASDSPPTWGFNYSIYLVPAAGGVPKALADTFDKLPDLAGWSKDGKKIYYTEARGTTRRLYALPLDGAPEEVGKGEGVVGSVSLNATRTTAGFCWEGLTKPAEAYVGALDSFESVRVSGVNKDLPDLPLGKTDVIRWKSKDGLEIEGLLTYPAGYERDRRYPLLVVIHGGPMGVFTERYLAAAHLYPVAVFAARGYAVLRCNIRGSSGYGQKFRYANYGDWGGKDFQDLMAGVDHVIGMGVADEKRLGVMGWSYGGYMTSWVITQSKRFKAASMGAGISNLMSFTGTCDIPSFVPDFFAGDSWDKLDDYRAHSAMFHVKGVTTPTLIQHGERDQRVPVSQSYELYNALKRQNTAVKLVVYPRTGHGVDEPRLVLDVMSRNVQWFDRYVRNGEK